MKPTDADRDPAFDRLIARGLEGETDVSGRACPDADLLAAWFDRSLSKSEAERIETHAAGCGSCQQILADLARSEPAVIRAAPVPEPARPWHWHWRWLVPVTTAVVVIVAVGNRPLRAPQPLSIAARQPVAESVSPAPASTDAAALPSAVAKAATPAEAAAKDAAPLTRATGMPRSQGTVADATAPQAPPQARADEALGLGTSKQAVPKPAEAQMRAEENIAVAAPAGVSLAAGSGGAPMKTVAMKMESRALQAPPNASSPGGQVAWRVGGAGRIERSVDRGVSWQAQVSGVGAALAAASATSDTNCWAVGVGGLVLRTVDGSSWKAVTAPTGSDLVFVRASSEHAATVRASDGSEYSTSDGGRTWTKTSK